MVNPTILAELVIGSGTNQLAGRRENRLQAASQARIKICATSAKFNLQFLHVFCSTFHQIQNNFFCIWFNLDLYNSSTLHHTSLVCLSLIIRCPSKSFFVDAKPQKRKILDNKMEIVYNQQTVGPYFLYNLPVSLRERCRHATEHTRFYIFSNVLHKIE